MEELLQKLSKEVRELSLGTTGEVERVEGPLSPLQFLRDFVLPGKPCIITGAIDFWPALTKWSNKYLASTLRDEFVSVHFTPDGRADSLIDPKFYENDTLSEFSEPDSNCQSGNPKEDELIFVTAHVENMSFPAALDTILASNAADGVAYAQQQNNCFISEYKLLHLDAELHIPWATEALGCLPEAVNLWIGNEKSVTSFHKDHYENLYAVVAGEKHFTLLPPVDVHRLYIKGYSSGTYVRSADGKFSIKRAFPTQLVPWVTVDPDTLNEEAKSRFPRYFEGCPPFTCKVQAGEILYLPSMWFHHVKQKPDVEGRTIAINFWYDMQFDIKFAYFNFLESFAHKQMAKDEVNSMAIS